MVFQVPENNKNVVVNNKLQHCIEIADFFQFVLPIKNKFFVNYVDLFFKVDSGKHCGAFSVGLVVGDKITRFVVPHESLRDGIPLRLSVEAHPLVSDKLGLVIKTEGIDVPLKLWVNAAGPCLVINGDCCKNVELAKTPLISIITPLYESSLKYLTETIASVQGQYYTNWELCLVDDGTNNAELRHYLHSLKNPKIRIRINKVNRGISEATNIALQASIGDYVCFLDHDDLLTPDALLEVACVINAHPTVSFIYTDEDKIAEDGKLSSPFFKPDWSYNLFLSQNYTCHLSAYDASIARYLGIRAGYDGSQDYDFALRFIEKIVQKDIVHIPKVCYHWRVHGQSTSSDITIKPNAHISAMQALKEHVERIGDAARVSVGRYLGTYHVDYELDEDPWVHVIIPTKDNPVYLKTCLFSLMQSTYPYMKVTVVDNGSTNPEVRSILKKYEDKIRVRHYNKPFNFSAINNFAVRETTTYCEYQVFLNDDTEIITKDWIEHLLQHMGRNMVAVAGAKLLYSNNKIQHAGVIIGIGGVAGHSHKHIPDSSPGYFSRPHLTQNVSAVTGACLMISSKVFNKIDGFDETLPKAFNDIDLCLRVRKLGYNIVYTPHACLFHHESVSRGLDNHKEAEFEKAIAYMQKKWDCKNFRDPYYNPNLTLVDENFSYKIG
jgi:GT2 family glycosyltransferase